MRIIYLALFVFSFFNLSSQNTPVISKCTATWCPNCGAWGWDFMEQMKDDFQTGPAMVLGVHYKGSAIENETSLWFAKNLKSTGQPTFFVNNERISAGSSNWMTSLETLKETVNDIRANSTEEIRYNSVLLDNGTINISADVKSLPASGSKFFLGSYVFENNVEANQSQQGSDALHPNVLRAAFTTDYQGIEISETGEYEFNMDIDADWQAEELGVLTILWEETGDNYTILASNSLSNISLLSATDDILDTNNFKFRDGEASLIVEAVDGGSYQLAMTNMSGHTVMETSFDAQVTLDKSIITSGMYIVTLRNKEGLLSQQVFVK